MSFDEVIGHDQAREFLSRAFRRDRISHAYLLTGPEGIGKGLLARQMAAALLCAHSGIGSEEDVAVNRCGECRGCQALAGGNHGGFQRLASEDGRAIDVESLREMMRSLSLRSGDRRVIVIEPAERMAETAANALLKILEEPPAGVVFLLISHRPAQLLTTIISRSQRVALGPLAVDPFLEIVASHEILGAEARQLFDGVGGRPGAAITLQQAMERCGGETPFRALLRGEFTDPRDLLAVAGQEQGESDRHAALATVGILADGLWAFRPEDLHGRSIAAEKATMLSRVARHVEHSGSVDLVLEAVQLILSALDLASLRQRMPRSLGVA